MNVELIAMTHLLNPEYSFGPLDVVEQAACVCYNSKPDYDNHKHAQQCARSEHWSVWEHINFTFHISGVSRALLAQLSRHRHISLSVRSQRYCDEDCFEYVAPERVALEEWSIADQIYADAMGEAATNYRALAALGVPKEDARMVLPNACCTELVMTANARALIEMSHLRLCNRAQREIREMFQEIRECVDNYCPEVAKYMVPKCQTHEIPFCEEATGCGKEPKLKDYIVDGKDEMQWVSVKF